MFFLNLLARATTWISRGAMCAPVFLLLGCPPGPETPETIERPKALLDSVFRPKWVLDTTIGVFELVDMNGCAKSLCTQRSAELARVCWEVQPIDGRIWTRNNDGEPCSCRCPELLKYTRSQRTPCGLSNRSVRQNGCTNGLPGRRRSGPELRPKKSYRSSVLVVYPCLSTRCVTLAWPWLRCVLGQPP